MLKKHIYLSASRCDVPARNMFLKFMQPLVDAQLVIIQHDDSGLPGDVTDDNWRTYLAVADAVVLLLSADYLASEHHAHTILPAIEAAKNRRPILLVPVLVSQCLWQSLQLIEAPSILPHDGKAINSAPDQASSWTGVCRHVAQRLGLPPLRSNGWGIGSAERARLHTLSKSAGDDAAVVDISSGPDRRIYRLDENLYVHRSAEASVRDKLNCATLEQPISVLVTGEAGRGKTSLLWRLYEDLLETESWEPWFLKAGVVARILSGIQVNLSTPLIMRAIDGTLKDDRRPVILLDTIDLLLHDETSRDDLRELLLTVNEAGCSIVATCRPSESLMLRWPQLAFSHVTLHNYDDRELPDAIDKHVTRFYENTQPHERREHLDRIIQRATHGRSLGEVCANPLTLRMLFAVYAPKEVPLEINVFELYERYWNGRVRADVRHWAIPSLEPGHDLSKAVCVLALRMLSEGTPLLSQRMAEHSLINSAAGDRAVLLELINRGVLQQSDDSTIEFFHQTFFEHAAARALLSGMQRSAADGFSALLERIAQRPVDLFLLPVLEQGLLLGESDHNVHNLADNALAALLSDSDPIVRSSAVYVYVMRAKTEPRISTAARAAFTVPSAAVANQLFAVAPSIASTRLAELFALLDVVWLGGSWRVRENLLSLLEQFAASTSNEVCAFLIRHNVRQQIVARPADTAAAGRLRRVLSTLARFKPEFVWLELAHLYSSTLNRQRNREQHAAIVEVIINNTASFGVDRLGSRFEKVVGFLELSDGRSRDMRLLASTWGRLFALEWHATPLIDICKQLEQTQDAFSFKVRLNGLAALLAVQTAEDARAVWAQFLAEKDVFRRWTWCSIVWAAMLSIEPATPAIAAIHAEIVASLTALCLKPIDERSSADAMLLNQLTHAAAEAIHLSHSVLAHSIFDDPARWLDPNQLGGMLAPGVGAGHPAALNAVKALLAQPKAYQASIKATVVKALSAYVEHRPELREEFLSLCAAVGNAGRLLQLLMTLQAPVSASVVAQVTAIETLRLRLLASTSAIDRRLAVQLWERLLRLRLITVPCIDEITDRFRHEVDAQARATLAVILGHVTAACQGEGRDRGIRLLTELARNPDLNLREQSFAALVDVIYDSRESVRYLDLACVAALAAPADAGRIGRLGHLIEQLLPEQVAKATQTVVQVLTSSEAAALGVAGRHRIRSRWRRLLRQIVHAAPQKSTSQLLDIVPRLDANLGQLVVSAVCAEALSVAREGLNCVLGDERVPDDVKLVIRQYRKGRDRNFSATRWSEVLTFLPHGPMF